MKFMKMIRLALKMINMYPYITENNLYRNFFRALHSVDLDSM